MARFRNGAVPRHLLIEDSAGNLFFPGTWRRWQALVADVKKRHGVTLRVSPRSYGAGNAYRSLEEQWSVRSALGVQAAVPGNSSHGGVWTGQTTGAGGLPTWVEGRESGAIDVYNWSAIGWAAFKAAAERAGFITNVVVPQELWHIVDLDPWGHKNGAAGGGGNGRLTMSDVNKIMAKLEAIESAVKWGNSRDGGSLDPKYGGETIAKTQSRVKQVEEVTAEILRRVEWMADARIRGSYKGKSITALLEAIFAAVTESAEQQGLDMEKVNEAISTAVKESLDDIEITLKASSAEAAG